jgi:hypothetical protein
VAADNRVASQEPRQSFSGVRLGIAAAGGLALLALVETAQALIAPTRAPADIDWQGAAAQLRVGFQAGDLIVAAPPWADPVMRMHVGDLLPIAVAARMDDARFGRVWEISQRGAHAVEMRGRAVSFEQRFGALTLRRAERPPAEVTFDFLERWQDAYVTRWDPVARASVPCPWQIDRFGCPLTGNAVRRALVEVDTQIRRAIVAPPVRDAIIAIEFQAVTLGRELAVAVGLHDTWARKSPGTVTFEVWIAGRPSVATVVDNRSGWRPLRIDTSDRDGQVVPVRFQISSPRPDLRYLAFAAEARR